MEKEKRDIVVIELSKLINEMLADHLLTAFPGDENFDEAMNTQATTISHSVGVQLKTLVETHGLEYAQKYFIAVINTMNEYSVRYLGGKLVQAIIVPQAPIVNSNN